MKNSIIGYLTGMINSYSRIATNLKESNMPYGIAKSCSGDLTDLLDFIMDIPVSDTKELEKELADYKECEEYNESVIGDLRRKVERLERSNNILQSNFRDLVERNIKLQESNSKLAEPESTLNEIPY